MPNPAAIAYEAYRKYKHENSELEIYLLSWEHLSVIERKAWWEVVRALTEMKGPTQ